MYRVPYDPNSEADRRVAFVISAIELTWKSEQIAPNAKRRESKLVWLVLILHRPLIAHVLTYILLDSSVHWCVRPRVDLGTSSYERADRCT